MAAAAGKKLADARRAARERPGLNPAESPLGWLARRRDKDGNSLITEAQLQAGERLRADFWFAQMTPRVTTNWSAAGLSASGRRAAPGAGVEMLDAVASATERVRLALRAVGPELSQILIDVCCHLKGLEELERKSNWPQRSAKLVLGLALSSLARHYGLVRPDGSDLRSAQRVQHWGRDGYRPGIDEPGE